jgi:ABC-type glutathione transport system ATPase component
MLDDFSYDFNKGDRIGIVGRNGVGKVSTVKRRISFTFYGVRSSLISILVYPLVHIYQDPNRNTADRFRLHRGRRDCRLWCI